MQPQYVCDMTRLRIAATVLAMILAAASATAASLPPVEAWEIGPWARGRNYSVGMPLNPTPEPGGSLSFEFPLVGRGEVDALTTAVGPLAGARQITMRYRIDAARGTRFRPTELEQEPATVSLYFQRRGDTWTARGRYASYRWYVPARAVMPLSPGEHTMTVRFDEVWTNVNGQPNTVDPVGFAAALEETSRIGIAFGSPGRRSHGVHSTEPARFTLLALDIR